MTGKWELNHSTTGEKKSNRHDDKIQASRENYLNTKEQRETGPQEGVD